MATLELTAQPRTIRGKEVKKLRREGLVPAVVYGPGLEGVHSITLVAKDIERIYTRLGKSAFLRLRMEGGVTRSVLIHQVQHDHTHRRLTHVDFLAPNMRIVMTIAVPVVLTGESPAVRDLGGIVVQGAAELQVSALPDAIPGVLAIDISGLTEIHAQLTAGDIELPEGVTLIANPDEVIVTISQVQLVTEDEEAAAEAAEGEGAEGEGGEGEESSSDSPDSESA